MERAYAVILAGGSGTRLWPRSRKAHPKQLIDLIPPQTLLQKTYQRIVPLIPPERIYVATGVEYLNMVQKQLPDLPRENLIGEPTGHNTAPCIGLAALHLARRDPQGTMICLHADHIIEREEEFRELLVAAAKTAEQGHLVTLGIVPDYPGTGYGYIHRGERLGEVPGRPVFRVRKFTEKPDAETAKRFLASREYFWNSGMFLWQLDVILKEFSRHLPRLNGQLERIEEALGTEQETEVLERVWGEIEDISIDEGIMERAGDVVVMPADIGWNDVGSWATVGELLPHDATGNAISGEHLGLDTANCVIDSSGRLVATIGLRDIIIVDTADALLVCPKGRAQEVRRLVELLKRAGKNEYV